MKYDIKNYKKKKKRNNKEFFKKTSCIVVNLFEIFNKFPLVNFINNLPLKDFLVSLWRLDTAILAARIA